ncbi:MAG: hypothetical protein G01um101470_884 [Parcubacteria group bacterium Gr01-1014_70]|nr:MAG: hypothetical protein G01um101470_884 [Parcubacteria group bacterium Gr01-1014_70]
MCHTVGDLSDEEILEFRDVVRVMETAAKNRFGSSHQNVECLMNHGYRSWPSVPLVHWHFHPRYIQGKTEFAGLTFVDEDPTESVVGHNSWPAGPEVLEKIVQAYQEEIRILLPGATLSH